MTQVYKIIFRDCNILRNFAFIMMQLSDTYLITFKNLYYDNGSIYYLLDSEHFYENTLHLSKKDCNLVD